MGFFDRLMPRRKAGHLYVLMMLYTNRSVTKATVLLLRGTLEIGAIFFPSGGFLGAFVHMPCIAAVVRNRCDPECHDGQAEHDDKHHARRAGEKSHAGVVLVEDCERDKHAGKDDRNMGKYASELSHC